MLCRHQGHIETPNTPHCKLLLHTKDCILLENVHFVKLAAIVYQQQTEGQGHHTEDCGRQTCNL